MMVTLGLVDVEICSGVFPLQALESQTCQKTHESASILFQNQYEPFLTFWAAEILENNPDSLGQPCPCKRPMTSGASQVPMRI